jgi:hypothetical protein
MQATLTSVTRSSSSHDRHVSVGLLRQGGELGVTYLRTAYSWADSCRPDAQAWFDRQMRALDAFSVTLTFCLAPECEGIRPHPTSRPPRRHEICTLLRRAGATVWLNTTWW